MTAGGCRLCGGGWGPFRKGHSICELCFEWAREFAAGRGRGTSQAMDRFFPIQKLRGALQRLARGRQISDQALHYFLDKRNLGRKVKVDHCGTVRSLRGVLLRLSDDDRKRAGGAVFLVQLPDGDPAVAVRRPGSGGVAVPWEGAAP